MHLILKQRELNHLDEVAALEQAVVREQTRKGMEGVGGSEKKGLHSRRMLARACTPCAHMHTFLF
jgi:hypothetical protein